MRCLNGKEWKTRADKLVKEQKACKRDDNNEERRKMGFRNPKSNQLVNEPSTSEHAPSDSLILENNPFFNVLKSLLTINNAKRENSNPYQLSQSDYVLQISPAKGIHWVHQSEIPQIKMPRIDPALIKNLLDHFIASHS